MLTIGVQYDLPEDPDDPEYGEKAEGGAGPALAEQPGVVLAPIALHLALVLSDVHFGARPQISHSADNTTKLLDVLASLGSAMTITPSLRPSHFSTDPTNLT